MKRARRAFGLLFEDIQIGAENLHGQIGSDARDQLIEPHFDRLGESETDTGHLFLDASPGGDVLMDEEEEVGVAVDDLDQRDKRMAVAGAGRLLLGAFLLFGREQISFNLGALRRQKDAIEAETNAAAGG